MNTVADNQKVRVFVIDDSALTRQMIRDALEQDPLVEVCGSAIDAIIAEQRIERQVPDVLLLDLELPRMDGIEFLKRRTRKIPAIVFTAYGEGSERALEAQDNGAAAVIQKPGERSFDEAMAEVLAAVKGLAKRKQRRLPPPQLEPSIGPAPSKLSFCKQLVGAKVKSESITAKIVAIGASTGGTQAIQTVLTSLPSDSPPVLIVIHMPGDFTASFAARLDNLCQINVREARDGDRPKRGEALIAPGSKHMSLCRRQEGVYEIVLKEGPKVMHHRPSVEVLFQSVARAAGANAMGIMLTGMGADGAEGMAAMHRQNAFTVAQSEATCVVYGMPAKAVEKGAVDAVLDIQEISGACTAWMGAGRQAVEQKRMRVER